MTLLRQDEIHLVINTPASPEQREKEAQFRTLAYQHKVPVMTTLAGAQAAINGIAELKRSNFNVKSLQEYH